LIYAKSSPLESLVEHTNRLLENLEILKNTYGERIKKILSPELRPDLFWELLKVACILHDTGKANSVFQAKIRKAIGEKIQIPDLEEIPHNLLSPAFINRKKIIEKYGRDIYEIIVQVIVYHHERKNQNLLISSEPAKILKVIKEDLETKLEELKEELKDLKIDLEKMNTKYFNIIKNRVKYKEKNYSLYIFLKGFLHRLDHSASAGVKVENTSKENIILKTVDYIKNALKSNLRDLQEYALKNKDENLLITASTGMGKTEAALIWSNNEKTFFTLPLRVILNALYKRVKENYKYENVGLLHSTSLFVLEEISDNFEDAYNLYKEASQLSNKITFTTIDQIFPFVFRYGGYEKIYATLACSRVIIDEVQAYSPRILAVLLKGLEMIHEIGGKFMVMTATLPTIFKTYLDVPYKEANFFFKRKRHRIKVVYSSILDAILEIIERGQKNKVLVISNTVKRAVEIFQKIRGKNKNIYVNLLHSQFIWKDRLEKEIEIIRFDKNRSTSGIWITTQVVEASLDVDFDYLYTELSTLDSLFQRMGRCYRKREYNSTSPNIFVFVNDVSGIGKKSVYDPELHRLSLKMLKDFDGCILSEEIKALLVQKLYSDEFLSTTEYLKEFKNALKVLNNITDYTIEKSEVRKILRDINNVEVIPKSVYDKHLDLFEQFQNTDFKSRVKILGEIKKLTLNYPIYRLKKGNHYNSLIKGILVLDQKYDENVGVHFGEETEDFIW